MDKLLSDPAEIKGGPQNARLVFILGVTERSGTTYLQDILRLHPDCDVDGLELEEDHFVDFSHLLVNFVNSASRAWKQWWGPEQLDRERDLVFRCLGQGLISYLKLQVVNRRLLNGMHPVDKELKVLVTKSPSTNNLELFFHLFPNAELIILVRDGRAVVESGVRTFFRRFDKASRQWADRAQSVVRFLNDESNRNRKYLLVKYEDLYGNHEEQIRKILSFLRLGVDSYDFQAANNLPVRGSSTLRKEGAEMVRGVAPGVHWKPVAKTADFNPLARWSHWNRARHERFNWIAGDSLVALGYEPKLYSRFRWFWSAWNWTLDVLPVEGAIWVFRRIVREFKNNPNTVGAVRNLAAKAWVGLRPGTQAARRARGSWA